MNELIQSLKFDDKGLIPAVVQDHGTGEVLMLAYMNLEALEKSLGTGLAHYWSRSRNKLWLKGETSGHYQQIKAVCVDCDEDTLLLKVEQNTAACHTGNYSCFYRSLDNSGIKENDAGIHDFKKICSSNPEILQEVYDVIKDRLINPKEGSYTNYLLNKGLDKILKKVGEEAAEVIIASKNKSHEEIKYEIADLIYHIMVLMVERGLRLEDIYNELENRR